MSELYDKDATMQVLGCILQSPSLLSEVDRYRLSTDDFDSSFTKSIFATIYNLYRNGAEALEIIDIDNYISKSPNSYQEFQKNHGIEYLQDACDIAQIGNFKYYYSRVKKFSALRALEKSGFDIKEIYDLSLLGTKQAKEREEYFDKLDIQDIFRILQSKFIQVEDSFGGAGKGRSIGAGEGIRELKKSLKMRPEIGKNFQNDIFNTIVRGARRGKFYLSSGGTGSGKTRTMIGHACNLAFPFRFNHSTGEWEEKGDCERVLVITTELEVEEIQTMILAYISGVNEEKILFGSYSTVFEENIVDCAVEIMEFFSDNIRIEQVSDPSRAEVIARIRKHYLLHNIGYVFFDYIFSSPSLLTEFRDLRIREDVVLMMMATALKDVAVELNIFVWSGTQLSGDYEGRKGVRDQSFLRGTVSCH